MAPRYVMLEKGSTNAVIVDRMKVVAAVGDAEGGCSLRMTEGDNIPLTISAKEAAERLALKIVSENAAGGPSIVAFNRQHLLYAQETAGPFLLHFTGGIIAQMPAAPAETFLDILLRIEGEDQD